MVSFFIIKLTTVDTFAVLSTLIFETILNSFLASSSISGYCIRNLWWMKFVSECIKTLPHACLFLSLFALTPLGNLHHFFICDLS
jgi:hypothetical protein